MARKKTLTDQIASISPPPMVRRPSRGSGRSSKPTGGAGTTVDPNFNVTSTPGDRAWTPPKRPAPPQRPPNQSSTRVGSDKPQPKRKSYLTGVQQNYESDTPRVNPKTQESFLTFTRPDKPGMSYHEYEDPKTGKRRVVGVKKPAGPRKGLY